MSETKKDWDRTFMNWLMNREDRGWADMKDSASVYRMP